MEERSGEDESMLRDSISLKGQKQNWSFVNIRHYSDSFWGKEKSLSFTPHTEKHLHFIAQLSMKVLQY